MKTALELLLTNLGSIVAGLCLLLGLLLGPSVVRRRRVALAIFHAFQIVEDLQAEAPSAGLGKAAQGLKAADEWMRANGWRPLHAGEQELAKLTFKSLNAQTDAHVAVIAGALSPPKPGPA